MASTDTTRGINSATRKLQIVFPALLLSFAIIAVATSLQWSDNIVKAELQSSVFSKRTGDNSSYSDSFIPDIFDKVKPSVVKISPSSKSSNTSLSGSGFVYDKGRHIITNSHVVGTASSVIITFNNGNQYDAIVQGIDPVNDIAVLKISDNHTQPILPVQFANSSSVRVGERVFAIGNPYGFTNTLTGGFVSQLGRLLLQSGSEAPYPHPDMIQTDAIINPGNSGGPLINLHGQVIGMNTATISSQLGGATGLGFSIPSKTLLREVPVLVENGSYPHPWLGIAAQTLTSELNKEFGLSPNFKGVLVDSLVKDGPANKAGIQGKDQFPQGDIITALDGFPISNIHDLLSFIENNKLTGDKITVSVYRNNQTSNLIAKLGKRPITLYTSPYITSQTPLF